MNSVLKTVVFWMVVVVSAFLLWQTVKSDRPAQTDHEISYSRFLSQVADGQVSQVTIAGRLVRGADLKGSKFRVVVPPYQSTMLETLQQHGVEIWFKDTPEQGWPIWITNFAPLVLLAALWLFMIRQMNRVGRARASAQAPSGSTPSQESPPRFGS